MSGERFAQPSLDPLFPRHSPGGVEYELEQRSGTRSADAPASSYKSSLSGVDNRDRLCVASVSNSASERRRSMAADLSMGSLSYLVLVGLVAIGTTGAFLGSGFLFLKQPANETVAASNMHDEATSAAPETAAPNSVSPAPLGGPPAVQSVAVPEAAPTTSSPLLNPEPPAEPAAAADMQPSAAPHAPSPPAIVPLQGPERRPTAERHHHHHRTAFRRSHLRSAPQSAPQGFFDRLLAYLTDPLRRP